MANKNGNAGEPGEGPVLSEEEWAEFEKSFTKESTKTATYKEPSARQRELTEKWKKEQPKDTGWRTDGPASGSSPRAADTGTGGSAARARRRHRPWVRNLVWVLVAVLATTAIVGGPKLFSSKKDTGPTPGTTGGPQQTGAGGSATNPAGVRFTAAPLDPSKAAMVDKPWPAIDVKTALPLSVPFNGVGYRQLTTHQSLTCTESMSQALGDLVAAGPGCQQLVAGLYLDPADKMQFTVSVLSMKRAEDASVIVAALTAGGLDYQVVELDPPTDSHVPLVPDNSPGYTSSVMTVRSVVVVGAQYTDGGNHDKATLSGPADVLLAAVSKNVADYERSRAGG